MSTIKSYLNTLSRGYKERALRGANKDRLMENSYSMANALMSFQTWDLMPEKGAFWNKVHTHYSYGESLPDLPKNTVC